MIDCIEGSGKVEEADAGEFLLADSFNEMAVERERRTVSVECDLM